MSRFKKGDRVRHLFHKTPPMYRVGVVNPPSIMTEGPVDTVRVNDVLRGQTRVEWDYLEKRHHNSVTTRTPVLDRFGWVPDTELMHDDIVSALGDLA